MEFEGLRTSGAESYVGVVITAWVSALSSTKKKLIDGTVLKLGGLFLLAFFTYNSLISLDLGGVKLSAPAINLYTLSNAIYVLDLTLAMFLVVCRTIT